MRTLTFALVSLASANAWAQTTPAAEPAPAGAPVDSAAVAPASAAAAKPWGVGIQPRLGVVVPTSKLGPMVSGALEIDVVLPALQHRLVLGLDVSLTRPSHDGSVMDPRLSAPGNYTINETELGVALLAAYRFAAPEAALVPWVGAGPMLHMLKTTESTTIAPGDNTAQSTKLGFELGGGVDYRVGPGFVTGDVRLAYSKLDHTLTGNTNAGKVTVAAGYRIVF